MDHVSIPVSDLQKAGDFYDRSHSCGKSARPGLGLHVSFEAPDRKSVDLFFSRALAAGGRSAGLPGERPEYTQPFYGAFVFDLDGYKIYWGTTPGSYPNSVTLENEGLTTYVVENLAPGTYEFVATSFNTARVESAYSNPASKVVQ